MNNIFVIAKNTFKETIRDKIMYGILGFALLFLLSTLFFASISLGEDIKVVKDLGLAGIYIFSIIIAIFLGSSLIYKEIEKRTLYIMLSKPVSTIQFITGKYLGLLLSLLLNLGLMSIIYLAVVYFEKGGFDYLALWAILLNFFELSIFISLAILFSTLTTPLASTIYSIIVLYIGHSLSLVKKAAEKSPEILRWVADGVYYLFPNLEKFNVRNFIVYNISPTSAQIIYPVLYSLLMTGILLWLANLLLKKRDL
ncbi:MAG: ABC transporter permease subunit [Patescibacteria group bacterium]|jgi:ABC-type transport system involved in multi-copper enzyme maturation permease subunit